MIENFDFPLIGKLSAEDTEKLEKLFSVFTGYTTDDPLYAEKTVALAKIILLEFSSPLVHTDKIGGKTSDYVRKAVRYLHDKSNENISLREVAEYLHIAPAYLSDIFPEHAGCGFNEYLTRIRIGRARELLRGSDKTITEISGLCGFGCVSAMNRAFKKYLCATPSHMRKQ